MKMSLILYKEGKALYENELAYIPVNVVGYGRKDFYKNLISEVSSFNENKDILRIFKFLDGKLSKRSTGRLIYYLSTYPNIIFKVAGW